MDNHMKNKLLQRNLETMLGYFSRDLALKVLERDLSQGITLTDANPGDSIVVQTLNSTYKIRVKNPRKGIVVVTGGKYFPKPEKTIFLGSSWAITLFQLGRLNPNYLGPDLNMEFNRFKGLPIITSPVQSFEIYDNSGQKIYIKDGIRQYRQAI